MLLLTPAILMGDESRAFPFSIETLNANHDATDMSWMNECPAGKSGFVHVRDGHFVDGKGVRIRFLGVSECFGGAFPAHADADMLAARLAKLGVNCVRLHHMDNQGPPNGIWDAAYKDKQHLDAGQLGKLDYLIYAFKRHGIYVDINLHVSRQFGEADGLPDTEGLPHYDKGVDNFEPRMIALQKNYAKDLLTHLNPYTKARYVDEPAVAIIEINNENSLVDYCMDGTIATIPEHYLSQLRTKWNEWLQTHYESTAELRKAWDVGSEPIAANVLANSHLSAGVEHWTLEAASPAKASMEVVDGGPEPGMKCLHAALTHAGVQSWDFQVHQVGLDIAEGKPYTLRFWARANMPRKINIDARLDKAPWDSVGMAKSIELPTEWKHYEFSFIASQTQKDHNRVSFNLQNELGEVWISGVELMRGGGGGLPDSASLDTGNIDLPLNTYTAAQRTDLMAFVAEIERNYALDMFDYVKKTLGAKSLVIDTQVTYGGIAGLYRESLLDFGDIHGYWQHPVFPHKSWDPVDWKITNTPMVRALGQDTLTRIALGRLAGKPFTVSEYNHAAPSDYSAECVPMLAAFAAQQDWDGLFLFDYHASSTGWDRDSIRGYFDIDSHPAKIAFMPTAAAVFRRADVSPATASAVLEFPKSLIPDELRRHGASVSRAWAACGFTPAESVAAKTAVRFVDAGDKAVIKREKSASVPCVSWECTDKASAAFIINSPASRGVIGFASSRQVELSGLTIQPTGDAGKFAAITVVALDGKAIEQSEHLLISAVGRVENTGVVWNEDRTSVGNKWGNGPVMAEGVAAHVSIEAKASRAQVFRLDGGGGRAGSVSCDVSGGRLEIDLGAQWKTLWYEVVIER